jgi:hypothetical protein
MSNGTLSQLWNYRWPSGTDEQIAILAVPVETIERRFELSAEEWIEDGLGPARGFWCMLPSGRVISLVEFAHRAETAYPGPNLSVDSHEFHRIGGARLLKDALEGLGLTEADVVWARPAE